MFSVCSPDESAAILDTFRAHQEKLFADLNLHFLTLDMAAHELGAQAYRKYDIEAWMPGRQKYGEISSCSDCTDFQVKLLSINFQQKNCSKVPQPPFTFNHSIEYDTVFLVFS